MKLLRLLLALAAVAVVAGVAYVNQTTEPAAGKMANAAQKFLDTLSENQKKQTQFDFDDKERTNWHFVPVQNNDKKPTRKGLPLGEMDGKQRTAALELLRAGTSPDGYTKATTIISLEEILRDLEKGGAMVRNPGWYFIAVFGPPSKTGKWGWRVEGHHLSLNFTIDKGKVVSATPAFFGANPAEVKAGKHKGLRTLPEAEDRARELFKSLDKDQRKLAYREKRFAEIEEAKAKPNVGPPVGLPGSKLTAKQRDVLQKLIEGYANRMPPEVAAAQLAGV
ncbi:MAG TPA: DUF3500 domain-containing protein, partial [Gemmataceae bacterium]|nr:DUF3500 domain-containing protein [Gemmataceae bacterium]